MSPEHWLYTVPLRLRSLFRRRRADHDLDEELRDHIARKTAAYVTDGMTPQAARRAALIELGGFEQAKEECRDTRRVRWLQDFIQDLRYGLRLLRKSPGFTAVAILTIGLGIGATTAIFSVVDATLLHPLPYPQPEQLVRLIDDLPGESAHDVGMSFPEMRDFQHSGIFEYVSPITGGSVNLTGASQPTRIHFLGVAPNYFALLGVKPQLGRAFNPDDHTPGFTLEALISDGLWKRFYGSDPNILSKSVRLDNDLYRIVGVMPPGFHDPGRTAEERNADAWCANNFDAPPNPPPTRDSRFLVEPIARLKLGLTVAQAQSRMDALVATLQKQFPADYPAQDKWKVRLLPLKQDLVGDVRQGLTLLLAAVGLVLLVACVNVANLLLARASSRGREMAIRQALGGPRTRLVRQLLTESVMLSLLGGLGGLALLVATMGFLVRLVPESLPRLNDITINWTVLLFGFGASLVAGVLFGLAPAMQPGRVDLIQSLQQEGRGSTGSGEQARTRRFLIVAEFALSLVLMIAASLLLHSFWNLLEVRPGFNPRNVMTVRVWLPVPNDPNTDIYRTAAQEAPFIREVVRRGRTLPGVQSIAIGDMASLPLDHSAIDRNPFRMIREGQSVELSQAPIVNLSVVTPDYFPTVGIPLQQGRLFADSDTDKMPSVVVINAALARMYWPDCDALGKRIELQNFFGGVPSAAPQWNTIVGVVADARTESLDQPGIPQVYESVYQRRSKDLVIFLRGRLDPASTPREIREQVQAVNPELPVFGAQMLGDEFSASLAGRRFSMEMVALFALTALLLAGLGIYGLLAYIVSERRHEIGIRMALGAQRTSIQRMVLCQGLSLAIAGTAAGLIGALIVSRLMTGLLYGVSPADPLTFIGVAALLTLVALAACYIPARRAMRVDPMTALRYE